MLIHLLVAALGEPLGAPGVVSISDDTSSGRKGSPAGISFASNGTYYKYTNGSPVAISNWITPQANMEDYEIRATLLGGETPDNGTLDTWETLSTLREWTLENPIPSTTTTSSLQIEIRWTGNSVVQDTATYTLSAPGPAS